jgi:hypothetical protein
MPPSNDTVRATASPNREQKMVHDKRAQRVAPPDGLRAAALIARLNRIPTTSHIWNMVILLSLGGMFEGFVTSSK